MSNPATSHQPQKIIRLTLISFSHTIAGFNPSLFARSLASAATSARQVELEEEEDFDATPTEDSEPPASTAVPFQSLKGSVSHDTLKALTVRPFKFTEMSVVQERVLGLMPELIGVKKRTGEAEVEGEEKMDTNKVGEKQDLLVKVGLLFQKKKGKHRCDRRCC